VTQSGALIVALLAGCAAGLDLKPVQVGPDTYRLDGADKVAVVRDVDLYCQFRGQESHLLTVSDEQPAEATFRCISKGGGRR
jgi:hypothetical protein